MGDAMETIWQSSLLIMLSSATLAVLWGQAALHKWLDLTTWQMQLSAYLGLPLAWQGPMARLLPAAETGIAIGLLSPWRSDAAGLSAVFLGVYACAMAWQIKQGHPVDCGCGGMSLPVSWPLVGRNALLVGWSLLAAQPTSMQSWSVLEVVWLVAALLMCVLLYTAFHQLLRHAAWMRAQGLNQRGM